MKILGKKLREIKIHFFIDFHLPSYTKAIQTTLGKGRIRYYEAFFSLILMVAKINKLGHLFRPISCDLKVNFYFLNYSCSKSVSTLQQDTVTKLLHGQHPIKQGPNLPLNICLNSLGLQVLILAQEELDSIRNVKKEQVISHLRSIKKNQVSWSKCRESIKLNQSEYREFSKSALGQIWFGNH